MSVLSWIVWLLLSAVVMLASMWHYRRRETPGRGRALLAGLRAAAIAVLLLVLFDPVLPGAGALSLRGSRVLLDASLSMRLPAEGGTRWDLAREEARSRAGDRPVVLFGDAARAVDPGALPDSAPGDARTLLLPALQAAAEAGAARVVVLTDGGIEDADAVARWAPRLGIEVDVVRVGADVPNLSLSELSAPTWAEPEQSVTVEFAVAGDVRDSVPVEVRRDGRVIARTTVGPVEAGRVATGSVELRLEPATESHGWVRLEIALVGDDAAADDNVRTHYVQVGSEPAAVALVSFRPDWEPRFLAPVLQRSLGLPLRAWLRGATGRYIRLAGGLEAGVQTPEEEVRAAIERGQLVVLHGFGIDAPAWAHEAVAGNRPILIFPTGDASNLELPIQVGAEMTGDFYLVPSIPPSPVAGLLDGLEPGAAAPLASLRPVSLPPDAWAPLMATRGRQGQPLPIAAAGQSGARRWAIALGQGYWQWAFRGDAERQLYDRFWSALAGWLVRERATAALPDVRPARVALPRGAPIPWIAPGISADSIQVQISDESGAVAIDTTVASIRGDTAFTSAPAPGHFSYRARVFSGDTISEGAGVLTVERYSPEYARAAVDPTRLEADATALRGTTDTPRRGTPLHATAYPYILIVLLLAAEWILRRRWGLR